MRRFFAVLPNSEHFWLSEATRIGKYRVKVARRLRIDAKTIIDPSKKRSPPDVGALFPMESHTPPHPALRSNVNRMFKSRYL